MEILIRKLKELFEGVCDVCNNKNEHEIGLISSSTPSPPPPAPYDTPSPSWLTDGGAGLSSGHICTVIFALFRCHLPLPDFSQIDTRVWLTDLPHPTSPRPGYILAPVKHSRTFPVLLEHFISPLCFYHLRSSSSSTQEDLTVCVSENVKSVDITVCFVSLLTKCLKM